MKIANIESALVKLEEEDSDQLQYVEDIIEELELTQTEQRHLLESIKKEISQLEFLDSVKRNDLRNFHMYMPLIEVPAVIGMIYSAFAINMISGLPILALIATIGSMLDISYLNEKVYDKIDDNPNPIKRFISLIKKTMKSKKDITLDILYLYNDQEVVEKKLEDLKQELKLSESKKTELKKELSFIEGKIIGLEAMKLSSDIEEINDNTEVVKFVNNKKLELKP